MPCQGGTVFSFQREEGGGKKKRRDGVAGGKGGKGHIYPTVQTEVKGGGETPNEGGGAGKGLLWGLGGEGSLPLELES